MSLSALRRVLKITPVLRFFQFHPKRVVVGSFHIFIHPCSLHPFFQTDRKETMIDPEALRFSGALVFIMTRSNPGVDQADTVDQPAISSCQGAGQSCVFLKAYYMKIPDKIKQFVLNKLTPDISKVLNQLHSRTKVVLN